VSLADDDTENDENEIDGEKSKIDDGLLKKVDASQ